MQTTVTIIAKLLDLWSQKYENGAGKNSGHFVAVDIVIAGVAENLVTWEWEQLHTTAKFMVATMTMWTVVAVARLAKVQFAERVTFASVWSSFSSVFLLKLDCRFLDYIVDFIMIILVFIFLSFPVLFWFKDEQILILTVSFFEVTNILLTNYQFLS